jgi:2-polyprenyl-6-methoxyphenol hydroxylase-like FAD-dependent oxidoreductase
MSAARSTQEERDVLIVGAGPVGLLLANLLGRRGIDTVLIEKRRERVDWSRAIGLMPPSLEILAQSGIDDSLIARGVPVVDAVVHDDFGVAGQLDFSNLPSRHKLILSCPQSITIELLEEALGDTDSVELRRGCELRGIRLGPRQIAAEVDDYRQKAPLMINARWLIGCDGASSTTRGLARIAARRKSYAPSFVMGDYPEHSDWGAEAHLFFTRRGSLESFPLPGGTRRWVAMIGDGYDSSQAAEYLARQIVMIAGLPPPAQAISPIFEFQPERLAVERLYSDRVVLAGDAAHVMSPIGGQGMNSGFGDAAMLAEFLPKLLAGANAYPLLDEYDRLRRRAAAVAARRAALGMWLGTRCSRSGSILRSALLRGLLLRQPLSERLPAHFAMLTIPGNSAGVTA